MIHSEVKVALVSKIVAGMLSLVLGELSRCLLDEAVLLLIIFVVLGKTVLVVVISQGSMSGLVKRGKQHQGGNFSGSHAFSTCVQLKTTFKVLVSRPHSKFLSGFPYRFKNFRFGKQVSKPDIDK